MAVSYGPPLTALDLYNKALARADMTYSSIVGMPEGFDYLSWANAELHDLLITTHGEQYLVEQRDTAVAAGASYVTLGEPYSSTYDQAYYAAPWRIVRVDRLYQTDRIPLARFSLHESILDTTARDWNSHTPRYDWRGLALWFDPPALSAESVRLYYVPYPQVFRVGTPTEQLMWRTHGHDRYLIVSAAIHMREKQESDVTALMAERDRIERMIRSTSGPKDIGEPPRVVDTVSGDLARAVARYGGRFDYR
jgi:hypothetical protein